MNKWYTMKLIKYNNYFNYMKIFLKINYYQIKENRARLRYVSY